LISSATSSPGDNNSDAGDPARWVYVMQNSDSGWRIGWQFVSQNPRLARPWLSERLCYPSFGGQAAYHLPPVAILGNGPSGLTYHPGTGMTAQWKDHFFWRTLAATPTTAASFPSQWLRKAPALRCRLLRNPFGISLRRMWSLGWTAVCTSQIG
jgi:hypothetical protein